MKLSNYLLLEQAAAIFRKDFLISLRKRAVFASMMMFALTAMASLSLSMRGAVAEPNFLAALLWVVIFFAASSGLDKTFQDEAAAGTLATLKIYAEPQSVLFGKIFYAFASLAALTIFLLPTFLILFDCEIFSPAALTATIFLGIIGFASSGTLIAALTNLSSIKGGLFPILLFPITLPIFLPAIGLTEAAFTGAETDADLLIIMAIFDAILTTASSILYDFLD